MLPKEFNTAAQDKPLRGLNYTQNPSSGWLTSLSGANPGDDLRFNVYYHNASSEAAQNTQITLNLSPSGESSSFTANAQIAATGFDTYTSNMPISLTSSQSLAIISTARWFHNYDGSNFEITDIPVNVSGSIATFNLGTVNPGYSGNDGYVEFFVKISSTGGGGPVVTLPTANAGVNQTVNPGTLVQLDGSGSTGTGLTHAWTCTNGITLNNVNIVNPTFTVPSNATSGTIYTCNLTVTDSNSNTASDSVAITVNTGTPSGGTGGSGGGGPIVYQEKKLSAEMLDITENKEGSVKLNGKITECSENNCKARFLWGTTEDLGTRTDFIENLEDEEEFSYVLKNLTKGKAYYASLEVKMGSDTFRVETPLKFITSPDKPQFFSTEFKNNGVNMVWKKGDGASKTLIKRGVNTCPEFGDTTSPTIYFGEDVKAIDNALTLGETYCYSAWMIASDDLELAFSDPVEATISIPKVEEKTVSETETSTTTTAKPKEEQEQIVVIQGEEKVEQVASPRYELSLKSFVRNISLEKLSWEENILASPNDEVEFLVEIENTGNVSLKNVIITNKLTHGLKDISDVAINGASYSNKILDRAFIKELRPNDPVKITFSAKVDEIEEDREITLLTETYSNQTKSITDISKINKRIGISGNGGASLFEVLSQGKAFPWIILLLIIAILGGIYSILKKRKPQQ
ncbi:MAG: hypothetical protein PHY30_01245 [Candidatus Pacebacteria bacterium]|nr:hypothetical protein [Candidatus Paceibacterota bacterium]